MTRGSTLVLLAVVGAGVFLAGLELMVTAVALPSILADLADPNAGSAWVELRKASWIINGYLLVYILTMPMAGRLADLWGARRLFLGALVIFIVGSALAGAAQTMDQLIAARLVQAVGGGVLVPVGTAAASHLFGGSGAAAGARRRRRADVPRHGRGTGRRARRSSPRSTRRRRSPRPGWAARRSRPSLDARLALGLLPQHPDRDHRAGPRLGRRRRLGDAAPGRTHRRRRRGRCTASRSSPELLGLTLARLDRRSPALAVDPVVVTVALLGVAALASRSRRRPRPAHRTTRSSTRACSGACRSASAALVSLLTGYAFATAIIGGAVFVDRVLYGGPDEQRLALGALAGATAVGALVSGLHRPRHPAPARGAGRARF